MVTTPRRGNTASRKQEEHANGSAQQSKPVGPRPPPTEAQIVEFNKYAAPFGKSNFGPIWELDTSHSTFSKIVAIVITAGLLLWFPICYADYLPNPTGSDRLTTDVFQLQQQVYNLLSGSAGINEPNFKLLLCIVVVGFLIFGLLDITSLATSNFWKRNTWIFGPHHTGCYDQLFSEPKRKGRLIGRLGNTVSNYSFFLAGLVVLQSAAIPSTSDKFDTNPMWMSDALFGLLLIALGFWSVVWHAANSMKAHYPDLWTMEACIFYLVGRFLAMALGTVICSTCSDYFASSFSIHLSKAVVTHVLCLGGYLLVIYRASQNRHLPSYFLPAGEGSMDYTAWWAARYRYVLGAKRPDLFEKIRRTPEEKVVPMTVLNMCQYIGLPVTYFIVPTLSIFGVLRCSGNTFAASIATASLVFGWGYRGLQERWALDGNYLVNFFLPKPQTVHDDTEGMSHFSVVVLSFISPTAVLHTFTGYTLMFGFLWARSIDQQIFA